jgi:hypothetical protein
MRDNNVRTYINALRAHDRRSCVLQSDGQATDYVDGPVYSPSSLHISSDVPEVWLVEEQYDATAMIELDRDRYS